MHIAPLSSNEFIRLKKLEELEILDSPEEADYDALTCLAATISQCPISLISLIDKKRQWFKSHTGLQARETPRDLAFCAHAILQKEVLIIEDARKDERFFDNPLVTSGPKVIFYAGIPLITEDNYALGTLCIIDHQPRKLSRKQIDALDLLARQVVTLFELRLANKKIREENAAKLRLLKNINHEMRTPLNILNGYIELIEDDAIKRQDDFALESCGYVKSACQQLLALVNDMVDQTSIDSESLKIVPEIFNLNSLIDETLRECRQMALQKAIKINFEVDKVEVLTADPLRVKQILNNLISNAVKYGHDNSAILIKVDHLNHDYVNIYISNSGNTIRESDQFKIFQRYFRSSEYDHGHISGLGLGLTIAKHLALAQGGDILLHSSVNSMTTFVLKLKR